MLNIKFSVEQKNLFEAFMAAPTDNQNAALSMMNQSERDGFMMMLSYYKMATRPDFYNAMMKLTEKEFFMGCGRI